jgi:hypothetical protein
MPWPYHAPKEERRAQTLILEGIIAKGYVNHIVMAWANYKKFSTLNTLQKLVRE